VFDNVILFSTPYVYTYNLIIFLSQGSIFMKHQDICNVNVRHGSKTSTIQNRS